MNGQARDLAVVCDFDGTIAAEDVCLRLLAEFAVGDWQQLDADYEAGKIDLAACLAGQVAMFTAPRETLAAFARQHARLRPGFAEFVAFCHHSGVELAVLSAGLDFYIDAILEREGLRDLDVTCIGTSEVAGKVSLVLPLAGRSLPANLADFKVAAVLDRREAGKRVIYVGDGSTDFAAARQAHHIFARDKLLAFCEREGIPCTPFADFADVRRELAGMLAE